MEKILEEAKNILKEGYDDWYQIVKNIINSDEFQKRKAYTHHIRKSVYEHSILVSAYSYKIAKVRHKDPIDATVAGILHDFYSKKRIYYHKQERLCEEYNSNFLTNKKRKKLLEMHAFTHAIEAADNSIKYYDEYMNDRVLNAIRTHMFPLSILTKYKFPKYSDSYIVGIADKIVTFKDISHKNN